MHTIFTRLQKSSHFVQEQFLKGPCPVKTGAFAKEGAKDELGTTLVHLDLLHVDSLETSEVQGSLQADSRLSRWSKRHSWTRRSRISIAQKALRENPTNSSPFSQSVCPLTILGLRYHVKTRKRWRPLLRSRS